MSENSENVLAHLEGSSPEERIEIAVRMSADLHSPVISVRQQAWGNGIGWFTQATVDIPAASLAQLKRALCLLPGAIQRASFLPSKNLPESGEAPTVIPFPGLRAWNEQKQLEKSEG